MISTTKL